MLKARRWIGSDQLGLPVTFQSPGEKRIRFQPSWTVTL